MKMADKVMTYRTAVKEIARQNGVYATFMPKPIFGQNGSGMHTTSPSSKAARTPSLTERTNTIYPKWLKLYRRFDGSCPGNYGRVQPVGQLLQTAGPGLRGACLCLLGPTQPFRHGSRPHVQPGKEKATRIEYRSPDPACNPYLAFAVMLPQG